LAAQTNPQREQGPSVPKVVLLEQLYDLYVFVLEWLFTRATLAGAAGVRRAKVCRIPVGVRPTPERRLSIRKQLKPIGR